VVATIEIGQTGGLVADQPPNRRLAESLRRRRSLIAPITTAAAVLLQLLVGLANLRRALFYGISFATVCLLVVVGGWYLVLRRPLSATLALAGVGLVLTLAAFGAPSTQATAPPPTPPVVGPPTPAGSVAPSSSGIVVEVPSEAEAIFSRAIGSVTPWYNDVLDLYKGQALSRPEPEAAISGAWWALADWCFNSKNGSIGHCYDLAGEYAASTFGRDPRTFNAETWFGAGAIGSLVGISYDRTAAALGFTPRSELIDDVTKDRPGIAWKCEPTCTAGWFLAHPNG